MPLQAMHVIVVGAGFGGLSAAVNLAREGARVTVLERAGAVGGKAAPLAREGYLFDRGPTLLTLPEIAEETFAAAGARLGELHPLTRLDPSCTFVFADGRELAVSSDPTATREAIARIDRRDADHWESFLHECEELWTALGEPYVDEPFDGIAELARRILRRGARSAGVVHARGTLHDFARRHFRSREMVSLVDRFATYAGASPRDGSAALAMIGHVEIARGAFYPRGGIASLAESLARAAESRGVAIRLGVEVTGIEVDARGRACAVTARGLDGSRAPTRLAADAIVADVDPEVVLAEWLPGRLRRAAGGRDPSARPPSISAFGWAFGMKGRPPVTTPQTVYLAPDLERELRDVFDRGRVARAPTIGVSVPTLLDPSRAPPGHHAVLAQVYAPATAESNDWITEGSRVRSAILARLERAWGTDLASRITVEAIVTPQDIALTGSRDGAIYGARPQGPFAALARPSNRARGVAGLYFAGGAARPGGGVTLAMRSGRFVRDRMRSDVASGRIYDRPSAWTLDWRLGGAPSRS